MGLESSGRLHHTSFSSCDCNCSVTAMQCALGAVEDPLRGPLSFVRGLLERRAYTAWWRLLACLFACLFACSCVFSPLALVPPLAAATNWMDTGARVGGLLGGLDLNNGRMMRQCRREEWSGSVEAAGGCTVGQRKEVDSFLVSVCHAAASRQTLTAHSSPDPISLGWTGRWLVVRACPSSSVVFAFYALPCFALLCFAAPVKWPASATSSSYLSCVRLLCRSISTSNVWRSRDGAGEEGGIGGKIVGTEQS